MRTLRTGILGCGGFAARHAERLLSLTDHFEMVAFCDRNHDRAERLADQFTEGRAAVFTATEQMLDESALDVLLVCLPPYGHTNEVELAADRGIHLFMEKPIALSSDHAWRMVHAAEAAGIVTQVGFMFRFGAAVERLRSLMDSGEAGQAGLMTARYFCNALHADWWRRREKSGGQLVEQVIHMFDLMRYLMGEARSVYSVQRNLFHQTVPDYTVEDISGTVIDFASGGIGVLSATNNAVPGRWINDYRVVTGRLVAEFRDANHADLTYTAESPLRTEMVASDDDVYIRQFLDFHHAVMTGAATRTPLREGARSLDLALAAARSAAGGAAVVIGDDEL